MANQDDINKTASNTHWEAYSAAPRAGKSAVLAMQEARWQVNTVTLIESKTQLPQPSVDIYLRGWRQMAAQVQRVIACRAAITHDGIH